VSRADPLPLEHRHVLGMRVDATSYADASARVLAWARERTPRTVCVANVHMTMEAWDDPTLRALVNASDLVTPDGMPLVWTLRRLGVPSASRVYGPTLTLHVCEGAARQGVPVGFHGGSPEAIEVLVPTLEGRFPGLQVAYAVSPPFRPATSDEDAATVEAILDSGARILFVGLGCPKQERWMAAHRNRMPLVQLGVGAAFDFHAGRVRQAPPALQRLGFEWAFRLAMEPRRLAKRYLKHNPRFVWHVGRQLWNEHHFGAGDDATSGDTSS
jgi:N-acetylglucosaminyldiphosphoundecaprenol N-acetyl-beta-D-mannosaminyltransferase